MAMGGKFSQEQCVLFLAPELSIRSSRQGERSRMRSRPGIRDVNGGPGNGIGNRCRQLTGRIARPDGIIRGCAQPGG